MCKKQLNGKMIGVLAVFLVIFMAVGVAEEERTDASGQWKYVLEDGGATIRGNTVEPSGKLVIPNELDGYQVKGIGDTAFAGCVDITSVSIPDSVTRIGGEAFARCFDLTGVAIPDSVTSIGEWAFKDCVSLTDLTIGGNVTSIDALAFFACESLTDVTIPDSVTSIGSLAFADCFSLSSVTIPAGVTSISNDAFQISPGLADFHPRDTLIFRVEKGSYAELYAIDNGHDYVLNTNNELDDPDDDGFIQERSIYDDDWYDDDDWFDDDEWYGDNDRYGDDDWFDDDDWTDVYPGMYEDGWPAIYAELNQRMSTRTGPGTKYTEDHGTMPESTEIVVYAQEDSGGTPWALVEFVRNGKLVRAYTGMKRIDADSADIRITTKKPKEAVVTRDTQAYYGPDTAYLAVIYPVAVGTEVLVYGVDRGYALIDYAISSDQWMRSWVPESCIEIK